MNVPVLAGTSGTDKSGLGLNPSCDASGSCNVQDILINNTQPSTFFQPFIGYNNMQQKENSAVSSYNALQFNLPPSVQPWFDAPDHLYLVARHRRLDQHLPAEMGVG